VDVGWAFKVARRGLPGYAGSSLNGQHAPPTGDHKGPPSRSSPPSPLQHLMGFS